MKFSAVKSLIVANVTIYGVQLAAGPAAQRYFELWPLRPIQGLYYFRPWQPISYAFLHSTGGVRALPHLLLNLLGLWIFGRPIERAIGALPLYVCYFAAVLCAALAQLALPPLFGLPPNPIIGASGGVFGLLLVDACLFPQSTPFNIPSLPVQAWLLAVLYGGFELAAALTGTFTGYPHFAHLGGMLGGLLVLMYWRFSRSRA